MQNELTCGDHIYYLDRQSPQYIVEVIDIQYSFITRFIWVTKWWGWSGLKRVIVRVPHVILKNNFISRAVRMDIAKNWKRADTE
jgi:hypothetical protein